MDYTFHQHAQVDSRCEYPAARGPSGSYAIGIFIISRHYIPWYCVLLLGIVDISIIVFYLSRVLGEDMGYGHYPVVARVGEAAEVRGVHGSRRVGHADARRNLVHLLLNI